MKIKFILLFISCIGSFSDNLFANIEIIKVSDAPHASCEGAIEMEALGSAGPFTLILNNLSTGASNSATDINGMYTFSDLCPGNYEIVVINLYGCETSLQTSVEECPDMTLNNMDQAIHQPSTCDSEDGYIYFRFGGPAGGTSPYVLTLYDSEDNEISKNGFGWWAGLAVGNYYFKIVDADNCSKIIPFELTAEESVYINDFVLTHPCGSTADGEIELVIAADPDAYTITWSTGASGDHLTDLGVGTYCATVTSANCEYTDCFTLEPNTDPSFTVSPIIKPACSSTSNDGRIDLSITGDGAPFDFSWSNGAATQSLYNVRTGQYCVTVTDRCGNQRNECYSVGVNTPIIVTGTVTKRACRDEENSGSGAISINVSGGSPPYRFSWSNGSLQQNIFTALAGENCVTVTDNLGCAAVKCFTVGVYSLDIVINDYQQCQGSDCSEAFIDIEVFGNDPGPFTYEWFAYLDNGQYFQFSGQDLTSIPSAASYCVKVQGACEYQKCIDIADCEDAPYPLVGDPFVYPVSPVLPNGAAFVTVAPEDYDFVYLWQGPNGFTSSAEDKLNPAAGVGQYTLRVSNGCGSEAQKTFEITACSLDVEILSVNSACSQEGYSLFTFRINNVDPDDRLYVYDNGNNIPLPQEHFDPATSSYTFTFRAASGPGFYDLIIFNQDRCGGHASFQVHPSNIHAVYSRFINFYPDYYTGGFIPVRCDTVVSCQDRPLGVLQGPPIDIAVFPNGNLSCNFQVTCDELFLNIPGSPSRNQIFVHNQQCWQGVFCVAQTTIFSPIFRHLFFPQLTSDNIPVTLIEPLTSELLGPVDEDVIIENNNCVVERSCNGEIVERIGTGGVQTRIVCKREQLPRGIDVYCVEQKICGLAIIEEIRRDDIPLGECGCYLPIVGENNDQQKLVKDLIIQVDNTYELLDSKQINISENTPLLSVDMAGIAARKLSSPSLDESFSIQPNPFTHIFTISANDLQADNSDYELLLMSQLGQIVYRRELTEGDQSIDMSVLPEGIYIAVVKQQTQIRWTQRLVKLP